MSQPPHTPTEVEPGTAHDPQTEDSPPSPTQQESAPYPLSPPPGRSRRLPNSPPPIDSSVTTPSASGNTSALSPSATDRVFPVRSVISVDPTPTPFHRGQSDYFHPYTRADDDSRRQSQSSTASHASATSHQGKTNAAGGRRESIRPTRAEGTRSQPPQLPAQTINDIVSSRPDNEGDANSLGAEGVSSLGAGSIKSTASESGDLGGLVTHRFKHVVTEDGHAIITGRGGDVLQRCEDEPIQFPGAVQGFGLLIALKEEPGGSLPVRIVSENSRRIIGRSPRELFALESFTDILSEEQTDNLLDHIDFIKDEDADVTANGPEVFTMSVRVPGARSRKLWCAVHMNDTNPDLIICEFELEDDQLYPLVAPNDMTPELPADTLDSNPNEQEFLESTEIKSRPLRVLRSARKRKGEAAAMEVFNIMSQVQEQLASAPNLESFLKVLVGVVKELTGFHRVMIYQFDQTYNGRVVTELVDPRATKDLYKGLNFPASDIPKQARELYRINRVRMLYDRDQETARLVCKSAEDLENPLDLTHAYLRAMSPIHLKYLANMAVRSSMSISINAFNQLWGLVACHSYGNRGMRVSFPIRKMCRLVGDSASRNIERLSYASRLQARKLINTVPSEHNPSGYIIASSDDLLRLFDADFGLLSIRDETKILGQIENSQEALAMLEYLRMRKITSVLTSQDVTEDFPDLRYPPGFQVIAGMLIVPLSAGGTDFICFFRRGQLREVKWAGNPYEKFVREGTEGYLEPRKSFKTWRETVIGRCREWTEEEVETAAVLCLVYGKFIEVWRQKEAALQNSQLTRLLLANSAHEVRTPLNAIINYLEIALEGSLDQETRDNLAKSHSASKSLIYVINDLLDLTKTEEGGSLIKGETFDLKETLHEATGMFNGDAKRKNLEYQVIEHPGVPQKVIGDQRRVRQAISNLVANAVQFTTGGSVTVEVYVASQPEKDHVDVEIAVSDTGPGMSTQKLDHLFNDLEQVQSEPVSMLEDALAPDANNLTENSDKTSLGLGLALVARIVKNMAGQLRVKSEEGKGSRFVIQLPFDLPDSESHRDVSPHSRPEASLGSQEHLSLSIAPPEGERTLVAPSLSRKDSLESPELSRNRSAESLNSRTSKTSKNSLRSFKSGGSQRSDVDRLIEAMQEPNAVDRLEERSASSKPMRPLLTKRNSLEPPTSPLRGRSKSLEIQESQVVPPHQRSMDTTTPGEESITHTKTPVKAIKMPDGGSPPVETRPQTGIIGEILDEPQEMAPAEDPLSTKHMRVLVAEDDPVNSRIVQKRLEKLGHSVHLTVNGEECASAFGDKPRDFDVVLMDMQMPIVDGLTSTKMIRSFEKTHSGDLLSVRAALCGRIPIIAVSASLVEREVKTYIESGFDAWILKPISFARLSELMTAIVDSDIRRKCLYQKGQWECGGWFHTGEASPYDISTAPSGEPQKSNPSAVVEAVTSSDDANDSNQKGETDEGQGQLETNLDKGKAKAGEDTLIHAPEDPPASPGAT